MSSALLGLALLGVAGWVVLRARDRPPHSLFRLLVEALAIETVIAALVAVALAAFGVFRPAPALALAAALPLARLGFPDRGRGRLRTGGRWASPRDLLLLLVLTLVAPIALPRMEQLRMENDAGVYSTRAIHHLQTGGLRGAIPVRDRLDGELLTIFDRDNILGMAPPDPAAHGFVGSYLPGTYVPASDRRSFYFQFLPGWPVLMALWAGVFDIARVFDTPLYLYTLSVLLFGLLLERLAPGPAGYALALGLFASSPLLLFFSKYATSEILLVFLFVFVLYFLGADSRGGAVLAAAGVLLFVVSHSSAFLYAPLLLLPLVEAYRSGNRRLALFSLLAFGALLASLPLGHFFSPFYMRDIFVACFGFLPVSDPATAGLALVAAFYAAGFTVSIALLRRAAGPTVGGGAWVAEAERLLPVIVPSALALIAAWTAVRGYQLGWTDRFAQEPGGGAWSFRAHYVGQGWSSVAHLDIVSMVMATSLVGLPTVIGLAVFRGREMLGSPTRTFLLAAVLWTLAIYTFFRVDTPFNYYASRYFLPVLVPSTLLLLGDLLGRFRPSRGVLALLGAVGLGFNLYFDRGLYRYPSESEKLRFVQEVADRVGQGRVLFVRADLPIFRLLAVPLQSLRGISVIRIAHLRGRPETTLIERYAARLGLTDAAVLSTFTPANDHAFALLSMVDRDFSERRIVYPTSHFERLRSYHLYELVFAGDRGGEGASAPEETPHADVRAR